jgi:solute carrier family 35, member E1
MTYRFLFNVHYSASTYLSLLPLTLGVMLACSFDLSANVVGLICALGSTVVFVSQNIFIKKLHFQDSSGIPEEPQTNGYVSVQGMFKAPQEKEQLDKLNILFYSSGMAFLLMIPIWMLHEGGTIIWEYLFGRSPQFTFTLGQTLSFVFNGTVHFGQNIIAFSLLSVASPVAYSIAGLVKRIFVIVMSIIWFGQRTTLVQALGYSLPHPS